VSVPSLPRPLAKQIDRLARRAHAFHRFAHHPLCESYRGEVFRLGRRLRLCRGCTLFVAGISLGLLIGGFWRPSPTAGAIGWVLALALGIGSLGGRVPKLIGRLLPGVGLGLGLWAGWPCASLSFATLAVGYLLYRRRGMERSPCKPCHERDRRPCSGFALIVRRERAFQREADRMIERHHRGLPS
jgi:hypothetical protein